MTLSQSCFQGPGHSIIAGAPEGWNAALLADIAATAPVVFVCRDEPRMMAALQALSFMAPGRRAEVFPGWDCLPYDRVSPEVSVTARRMQTLYALLHRDAEDLPPLVLTTVSAFMQRVPPRVAVREAGFVLQSGGRLDEKALAAFLNANGYSRVSTVYEQGEYAHRGGLIDIFPAGAEAPVRLDLFGDEIEQIRRFDPASQRGMGQVERVLLVPVGEVALTAENITRFRSGYRAAFGPVTGEDPLYQSVSEGRRFAGMEHWLPLFHERMEHLLDYLPGARVCFDHQADEAFAARHAIIEDYYTARAEALKAGETYKPLPPERLYPDAEETERLLQDRPSAEFTPFAPAEEAGHYDGGARPGRDFAAERHQRDVNIYDALAAHMRERIAAGKRVVVVSYSQGARDRLAGLLRDHGYDAIDEIAGIADLERLPPHRVALGVWPLEKGFETADLCVISEQDVLGDRLVRPQRRRRQAANFIADATQLSPGDLVVHIDHGIGRYEGLETVTAGGAPHDCLLVVYEGGDKLYVPVENLEMLSRFGSGEATATLDRLGGAGWQNRKARLKERLKDIADDLIRVAAARNLRPAPVATPPEGMYDEFCARFPFQETDDQARAIDDVLADLARGKPMDRLVCGDVGFGKTEVALRSAFVMAMSGKQVAVVVPTTLLCRQHFATFRERFRGLPVNVRQLSRLASAREARETRTGLADGTVDIVIGTHALLSKSVSFRDLGLLIIDEEQHFGVRHKERLKELKADVHILTLSATPIPRTLQLALTGIRDLSLIATPPVDRLAVRSFVLPFDPVVVREALLREHYRGGQSFYVCPRIRDLGEIEDFLKNHVPEIRYAIAHGQMPAQRLDEIMTAFYEGGFDVLVSTNIVESGLDVPSANTMIVHRADRLGLAQLYQLRGRVGRGKQRGYAYLTVPPRRKLPADAEKRLRALQALDSLGAGFNLASYDMDIRGAGNLLGEEQSGHIREVGAELYQQMLEEAVAEARGGADTAEAAWSPQINIGTAVLIPESYIADLAVRLDLYRRLSRLETPEEINAFADEMHDRFGKPPPEVRHLLDIVMIKRHCRAANIEKLDAGPKGATIAFRDNSFANPAGLVSFIARQQGSARLRPDHRLVYMRAWEQTEDRINGVIYLVRNLAEIAAADVD